MLSFLHWDALPRLYCSCHTFLPSVFPSPTEKHAVLGWNRATNLATEEYSISFSMRRYWVPFTVCYLLYICTVKSCLISFTPLGWIQVKRTARYITEFILLLPSAVTSSRNINDPVPQGAMHAYQNTASAMFDRWRIIRITSCFFSSLFLYLAGCYKRVFSSIGRNSGIIHQSSRSLGVVSG